MRKLFKKSLACVLAVALCLTAMVGVLSVSADVTGTLDVQAFGSNVGENPYVIATFASADANELISEAFIKVEGASIATVAPVDGATGYAVELNDAKNIFNINSENGVASAAVKVVLDVTDAGEYTIKFIDVTSATDSQQLITFPTVEATVEVVAPHVHTEETIPEVPATCDNVGYTAGVKCSECDEVLTAPTEVPALGHKWDDGVETTAPTCDNAGVKTFTCLNDGTHTKTEAIDALGHDMKPVDAVPATCTTPGTEAGEKCSRCDATTGLAPIPALGHNYGDNLEFCANGCGTANPDYVPACDHANATLEYAVVDGNCVTTKVCPDCDAEPEVVYSAANITVTPALNLSSGLAVNFRIPKKEVTGTDVFGMINHDVYTGENTLSGTTDDVRITPTLTGAANNQRYQLQYTALAAREMGSQIHVKYFATVDENVVLVSAFDFVLADYLKAQYIDKASNYKTLAADILRYGAESQLAFDYREGALASAGVPAETFSALPTTFTNTVATQNPANKVALEPSTVLGNTVTLRFRANVQTGIDASALHFTVDYVNASGVATTYTSKAGEVGYNGNGKKYQLDFSSLPVAIINDYYTVTLWNGDEAISSMEYSFQSDAQSKYTANHSYKTLAQSIVAYSASAAAVFKTN